MSIYLVVIVGAAIAGLVQGLSGFAFGMTAMAIWAWSVEPVLAAQLAIFGAWVGQVTALVSSKRRWEWPLLWPFLVGGVLGVPVGVWLLPHVHPWQFQLGLGLLLVVVCPLLLSASGLPVVPVKNGFFDGVAGWVGGVFGGIAGISGTVPTLWATLRGLDKQRQRAVIQNFNLCVLTLALLALLTQGSMQWHNAPMFGVVAAAVLIPVLLGARLYVGLSERAFKTVVLGLLTASGIGLLVSSLPVWWAQL